MWLLRKGLTAALPVSKYLARKRISMKRSRCCTQPYCPHFEDTRQPHSLASAQPRPLPRTKTRNNVSSRSQSCRRPRSRSCAPHQHHITWSRRPGLQAPVELVHNQIRSTRSLRQTSQVHLIHHWVRTTSTAADTLPLHSQVSIISSKGWPIPPHLPTSDGKRQNRHDEASRPLRTPNKLMYLPRKSTKHNVQDEPYTVEAAPPACLAALRDVEVTKHHALRLCHSGPSFGT